MRKVVIIADDLTGANATGVLLAKNGYRTGAFIGQRELSISQVENYDVVSLSTDSRALPPEEAYKRVKVKAQEMIKLGMDIFSKRIDTTLRGNIGAEIDAMLDVLGIDTVAIVVAAFPSSGRITVGGYLIVNSIPLEVTFASKDPKTPVKESVVTEIVAKQSKYEIGYIELKTVLMGDEQISIELLRLRDRGKRIIVIDSATQEDLERVALGVRRSGLKVLAVDPGPFTAAIARHLLPESSPYPGRKKVFMAIGSVTPLVREQLRRVLSDYNAYFVYADAQELIGENSEREIARVCKEIHLKIDEHLILGVRTIQNEGDILDIAVIAESMHFSIEEVADRIAIGIAKITKEALHQGIGVFGALYTSGGDTTVSVCREIGAFGIEVKDEVIPLAAYGRVIGGQYNNIPIITKGGLVGDENAISTCIDYLLTKSLE